jgi:predicted MFS family arabinose efflux permease
MAFASPGLAKTVTSRSPAEPQAKMAAAVGVDDQEDGRAARWDSSVATAAALTSAIVSYFVWLGLPVILGSLVSGLGFNDQQIGWVGSAEYLGVLLGSAYVSSQARTGRFRRLALFGIAITVCADVATLGTETIGTFCMVRLIGGAGSGACYSASISCLSLTRQPTRTFTILMVVMTIANSLELWWLPRVVDRWGTTGIYAFLAVSYVAPAAFLWSIPARITPSDGTDEGRKTVQPIGKEWTARLAWLCLAGIVLFNVAATSFWAYAERIGDFAGMTVRLISDTLTICNLLGLAGSVAAYWMSRLWGQHRPQLVCLALMIAAYGMWGLSLTPHTYVIGVFVFFQVWAIVAVYQLGTLSKIDQSGHYIALVPAAQGVGQSAGPSIAGFLLARQLDFTEMLGAITLFAVGCLLAYAIVYLSLRQMSPALANE